MRPASLNDKIKDTRLIHFYDTFSWLFLSKVWLVAFKLIKIISHLDFEYGILNVEQSILNILRCSKVQFRILKNVYQFACSGYFVRYTLIFSQGLSNSEPVLFTIRWVGWFGGPCLWVYHALFYHRYQHGDTFFVAHIPHSLVGDMDLQQKDEVDLRTFSTDSYWDNKFWLWPSENFFRTSL